MVVTLWVRSVSSAMQPSSWARSLASLANAASRCCTINQSGRHTQTQMLIGLLLLLLLLLAQPWLTLSFSADSSLSLSSSHLVRSAAKRSASSSS